MKNLQNLEKFDFDALNKELEYIKICLKLSRDKINNISTLGSPKKSKAISELKISALDSRIGYKYNKKTPTRTAKANRNGLFTPKRTHKNTEGQPRIKTSPVRIKKEDCAPYSPIKYTK